MNYNICGESDFAICLNTLLFQGFLIWRRKICKALVCCKSVVSGFIWHLFQEFANNIALFWFKMSNREVLNKDESNNYSTSLTPAKFLDCCMLVILFQPIWHRWIKYQGIWEKKLVRYKSYVTQAQVTTEKMLSQEELGDKIFFSRSSLSFVIYLLFPSELEGLCNLKNNKVRWPCWLYHFRRNATFNAKCAPWTLGGGQEISVVY